MQKGNAQFVICEQLDPSPKPGKTYQTYPVRRDRAWLSFLGLLGLLARAQVSDLDKIHMQLCLDVDTFSQMAHTRNCLSPLQL